MMFHRTKMCLARFTISFESIFWTQSFLCYITLPVPSADRRSNLNGFEEEIFFSPDALGGCPNDFIPRSQHRCFYMELSSLRVHRSLRNRKTDVGESKGLDV